MMPKGQVDEQVFGVETIQDITGNLPKEIHVPYKLQEKQQTLLQGWNQVYVAVIPYCFRCKVALVWHLNPKDILFHCPVCGTNWVKGEGWEKPSE